MVWSAAPPERTLVEQQGGFGKASTPDRLRNEFGKEKSATGRARYFTCPTDRIRKLALISTLRIYAAKQSA
jgi:hypothetical protein